MYGNSGIPLAQALLQRQLKDGIVTQNCQHKKARQVNSCKHSCWLPLLLMLITKAILAGNNGDGQEIPDKQQRYETGK